MNEPLTLYSITISHFQIPIETCHIQLKITVSTSMVSFSNSRSVLRLHPDDIDENKTWKVETKDEWKGEQGEGFLVMFPEDCAGKGERAEIHVHLVDESAYIDKKDKTKDKTKWDKQPVSSQRANTVSYTIQLSTPQV